MAVSSLRPRPVVLVLLWLALITFVAASPGGMSDVQSGDDCNAFKDCNTCFNSSNGTCGWCARTNQVNLIGTCLNLHIGGGECAPPRATWIVSQLQCAAPSDSCSNYATNCSTCGTSPMELNCGWCLGEDFCVPGSVSGPTSDYQCGANGGWAFLSPCTEAALCREQTGCESCVSQPQGCGFCSSTSRCELGEMTGPTGTTCPKPSWYYNSSVWACQAPAVDLCNDNDNCFDCESADPTLQCGWCSLSNTCMTGNSTGPAAIGACGDTPALANWTLQACPSDGLCYQSTTCGECNTYPNCLWCSSSEECMPGQATPIPSLTCADGIIPYTDSCPSSGGSSAYPSAGVAAIACITGACLLLALRLSLYCCPQHGVPEYGTRYFQSGHPVSSYTRGCRRWYATLVVLVGLSLKLTALLLDRWDAWYMRAGWDGALVGKTYYGAWTVSTEMEGDATTTISYRQVCAEKHGHEFSMCQTLRAGALITFIVTTLSLLFSFLFLLLSLLTACRPRHLTTYGRLLWRLSGLAQVLSLAAWLIWLTSAHLVIHYEVGSAGVGPSWIVALCGWLSDLLLTLLAQRAVVNTPLDARQAAGHMQYGDTYHSMTNEQQTDGVAFTRQASTPLAMQHGQALATGATGGYGHSTAAMSQSVPSGQRYRPPPPPSFNPEGRYSHEGF